MDTAHTATYAPDDEGGFLVTCPRGCKLGATARQPDEQSADRRARLHHLATAPLTAPVPPWHGIINPEARAAIDHARTHLTYPDADTPDSPWGEPVPAQDPAKPRGRHAK